MISLKHRMQVGNADLSLLLCLTWTRWALSLWTVLDTSQRRPCFPSEMMMDSYRTGKFVHLFLVQNAFLFWTHPISEGVDPTGNFWIKAWSYRYVIIIPALYAGGYQIERTWCFFIIRSNHLTKFPDVKEHQNMWCILRVIWFLLICISWRPCIFTFSNGIRILSKANRWIHK